MYYSGRRRGFGGGSGMGIDWSVVSKWADRAYNVITGTPSTVAGAYDKFLAEIAPILRQKIGTPVYCFWFGETVGLDPSGKISVLGASSSGDQTLQQVQALVRSTRRPAWVYLNGQFVMVSLSNGGTHEVPEAKATTAGLPGTTGNWLLVAGVALGSLLLFRGRRRKAQ